MGSESFEELAFKADFKGLPKAKNREPADTWSAELVGALEVVVSMSPALQPNETFFARLLWDHYPDNPPSVLFRDPETGRHDVPQAWPTGGPFRPGNCLCVNFTREGFAMHPEWVNDPRLRWIAKGNVLLAIIRRLQDHLDNEFTGRQK
jgi:hypothetical protein